MSQLDKWFDSAKIVFEAFVKVYNIWKDPDINNPFPTQRSN